MVQVLVPQVEKMCLDKGLTDESEILRFLQHGTLVSTYIFFIILRCRRISINDQIPNTDMSPSLAHAEEMFSITSITLIYLLIYL